MSAGLSNCNFVSRHLRERRKKLYDRKSFIKAAGRDSGRYITSGLRKDTQLSSSSRAKTSNSDQKGLKSSLPARRAVCRWRDDRCGIFDRSLSATGYRSSNAAVPGAETYSF